MRLANSRMHHNPWVLHADGPQSARHIPWVEAVVAVIDICYSQQLGVLVVYSCLGNLHACRAHCNINVELFDLATADHEVGCTCMLSPNFMLVQHAPSLLCPDNCPDYVHLQYVQLGSLTGKLMVPISGNWYACKISNKPFDACAALLCYMMQI